MSDPHEIQTFGPVDRAHWEREKTALNNNEKLKAAGVQVTGDKGIAKGHGIEVSYEYNEATQTLKVQTLHTPFYLPEATVDQALHNAIEEAL